MTTAGLPRVLLIVGSGRSGSTLFERALAGVDGVVAVGELVHVWDRAVRDDELCACGERFGACEFWAAVGERAFGGWRRVCVDRMVEARRAVVRTRHVPALLTSSPSARWRAQRDRLVRDQGRVLAAAQAVSGARLLVDSSKLPAYGAMLMRAEVELTCVQVVRDPRGVANSLGKSVRRPEVTGAVRLMHRTGAAESAGWWSAFDLVARGLRRLGRGGFLTVRYEDFVVDPGGTVAEVLEAAGMSVAPGDLSHLHHDRMTLASSHQMAGNPVRFETGVVTLRPDETWRRQLSSRDRRTVELLTFPLRRRYGYR